MDAVFGPRARVCSLSRPSSSSRGRVILTVQFVGRGVGFIVTTRPEW